MDILIVLYSSLRETSELQAAFALQAVGIRILFESSDAVLDEFFGMLHRYTLLDVHLGGVARLECWGLKRDERGIAVWQVQGCVERAKVRMILRFGGLGGVDQ